MFEGVQDGDKPPVPFGSTVTKLFAIDKILAAALACMHKTIGAFVGNESNNAVCMNCLIKRFAKVERNNQVV